jgi:hypothetical protein
MKHGAELQHDADGLVDVEKLCGSITLKIPSYD